MQLGHIHALSKQHGPQNTISQLLPGLPHRACYDPDLTFIGEEVCRGCTDERAKQEGLEGSACAAGGLATPDHSRDLVLMYAGVAGSLGQVVEMPGC